jgi:hypothetical protein
MRGSSSALRRDLSQRNIARAKEYPHELSFGDIPSVIYHEEDRQHGNFLTASYRSICANPEWRKRLKKAYSGGKWVPRSADRVRWELDCANSSDALLMNVFCYPRILRRARLCTLLGIEPSLVPSFGFRPQIPLLGGRGDRTEIDLKVGDLLVESKLTETGFQSRPCQLLYRYRDLHEVFEVEELPIRGNDVCGYQLIRAVLAAYATECSFSLFCDMRRDDLIESWFAVVRAVRSYSFRSRLKLITWQDLAEALPGKLQEFLGEKYGIAGVPRHTI